MKPILFLTFLFSSILANAKNIYLSASGNDANNGLSISSPWKTIAKLNASFSSVVAAGDSILFKRGETFYGGIVLNKSGTSAARITLAAYGTGAKPLILGSKQKNLTSDWVSVGTNLWQATDPAFTVDVSNIIFNNETTNCGTKVMKSSPTYSKQGDFWYDYANDRVRLYSVGNPGSVYSNIQCALKQNGIKTNSNNFYNFTNLDFRYFGQCVWEYGGNNYTWSDVDLSYIGGADMTNNYGGRYGNGLQIWEGAHDITIQRCRVDNCYDAGISPQGYAGGFTVTNIFIRNNVISNCEYNFEFYERTSTATASNIYFENNTCINGGGAWSHFQRTDGVNGSQVRMMLFTAAKSNIFIRNNIFYGSTERLFLMNTTADMVNMVLDYNLYFQPTGNTMGQNAGIKYPTLAGWKTLTNREAHSIASNPLFVGGKDYHLQAGSPAIGSGINVGFGTTMGAYPYSGIPSANVLPVANAGADKIITLPTSSVSLTGTGTDADGTISAYAWTKVSGPTAGTIAGATSAATSISGLTQGVYVFNLKVTDNLGGVANDAVQVTVNAAPVANILPIANAGADLLITLPTSSVSLTGIGTDADGTISAYAWTLVSGPTAGTIASAATAATTISGLTQGVYVFNLKVTDNLGGVANDAVQVTVNAAPVANILPIANAGADLLITLPTSSVSLAGIGTDADGTISAYAWTQVSGPTAGTIASAATAATTISGLTQGTYVFNLKVTDNLGGVANDAVQVTVSGVAVVSANKYYFSNAGNDANNGHSSATPWKTITKLNAAFSGILPGDSIFFNRGETFYGAIVVNKSGTSASSIYIGAYGIGAKPIITGYTDATGFTNVGSNLWQSAAMTSSNKPNMVAINNSAAAMGRYPNTGYLTFESANGNTSITDMQLPASPNYTGAEVVIRRNHWIITRDNITNHSGTTITYAAQSTSDVLNGKGYIIQNSLSTLDVANEWYFNPSTHKITVYATSAPANVKVATKDTLLYIGGNDYITVNNLAFVGGNVAAICFGSLNAQSTNVTVQNCNINQSGRDAIYATNNSNSTINNNTISNSWNNAIYMENEGGKSINATITNNVIKNTGTNPAMGYLNQNARYSFSHAGITVFGDNALIQYNSLDSVGYNGISLYYNNSRAKNNYISNFNLSKDDGAGIYTYNGGNGAVESGKEITGNIIINGIGSGGGTGDGANQSQGIYLDDKTNHVLVQGNSINNMSNSGIYVHNAQFATIRDNTFFNCASSQALIVHDNNASTYPNQNIIFKNNILFSLQAGQAFKVYRSTATDYAGIYSSIDSNLYARPIAPTGSTIKVGGTSYTLASWKSAYSAYDVHSKQYAPTISATNMVRFEYNASTVAKTIALDAQYTGVDGKVYNGNITLQPYQSAILIKTGTAVITALTASAGKDTVLFTPANSTALIGSGTGTIASYRWTKVSGPAQFTIASATSASTTVSNLTTGAYIFQLKVVNTAGDSALAAVAVNVTSLLAAKIVTFSGTTTNSTNLLQWDVASDVNVKEYAVERSADQKSFNNIGQLPKAGASYNFEDKTPLAVENYYRVKLINKDGSSHYSKTLLLTAKSKIAPTNTLSFSVLNLTLSGTQNKLTLRLNSNEAQNMSAAVVDASGRIVTTLQINLQKGINTSEQRMPVLSGGIYYVKMMTTSGVITKAVMLTN